MPGYVIHLAVGNLFYNRFLEKWVPQIYDDYNRLNAAIIEKYSVVLPPEISGVVKYKTGDLALLDRERVFRFIDAAGKTDVRALFRDPAPDAWMNLQFKI